MWRLLERETEIRMLDEARDAVIDGSPGRIVVVEGLPGTGVTSLLRTVWQRADVAGFTVLRACGAEQEREFPDGVVHRLLQVDVPPSDDDTAEGTSYRRLMSLHREIRDRALRTPVIAAVDDAQWIDASSARFLSFLVRRLDETPMLLVLGVSRDGPVPAIVHDLMQGPAVTRLRTGPLSARATTVLVRDALGASADPGLCTACHEVAGGNPHLLREVLAELTHGRTPGVPPSEDQVRSLASPRIAAEVLLRLGRCGAHAVALARAAAVLGDSSPLRTVAAVAGVDGEDAARSADLMSDTGVVRPGEPVVFVHPVVRRSLYDAMPYRERAAAHRRAARVLADEGAVPDRVADHLVRTDGIGDPWTVDRLRAAARWARSRGAADTAVAYLRRAMDEPPPPEIRGDVLAGLGRLEILVDGRAAEAHLAEAAHLLRRADIQADHAWALYFQRRTAACVDAADAALESLPTGPDTASERARLEAARLIAQMHDPAFAAQAAATAMRVRREPGDGAGGKALIALAAWRDLLAGRPCAAKGASHALRDGDLLAHYNGNLLTLAAMVLELAGFNEGLATLERGIARARESGSMTAFAANRIFAGRAHFLHGRLAAATTALREGLAAAQTAIGVIWSASWLADALREQGLLAEAEHTLARAADAAAIDDLHSVWELDSRSRLLIARGDLRSGLAMTRECGRRFAALGGDNPAVIPWRSRAASVLAMLGEDIAEARRLTHEELTSARTWGAPRPLGAALRAAGRVTGGDDGITLLSEAVETLAPSRARLELAYALTDLGAALRRTGRRGQARRHLLRGLEIARDCGAMPLVALAQDELAAAGGPRRSDMTGVTALTPSEHRVARQAADGLSNREIAAMLVVTVKTVESHLASAYRKLGIRSRRELPAALGTDITPQAPSPAD